jgi:amidohydrolase
MQTINFDKLSYRIKQRASELLPNIVEMRRHLHRNPELSFKEFETANFVEEELKALGLPVQRLAETGLVALIEGVEPHSKTIALRADMDALPIRELNKADYCSLNDGVMHACGHDVHTSSLLGVANILSGMRDQIHGTVKLIFQPGEEKIPGGASLMIKEGVLKKPDVSQITGQHVMPLLEVGKVGFRKGMYMASADEIYMTIIGKGGHGAHPQNCIDPIAISAQVITALQQVVSRSAKPSIPSVLSIGKVIANGATNVIPDEVYMEGTFRTFDEEWRHHAHTLIQRTVRGICEAFGATCEIEVRVGYPFLENDPEMTDKARNFAVEYLGEENVVDLEIWPAGEDFAFYTREVPGCFYRLGTRNESKGIVSMLHTPTFDIDENALETGMGLMAYMALRQLGGGV